MLKYLSDNLPLTSEEKQLIKDKGQYIYEKVKADGGFIKVFCQRELPKYLQENDWAHLYQSKIITYEYKQNVDGSCIGKPHYYTNKEQIEIYQKDSLSWLEHQISILTLDPKALEMLNLYFTFEALKQNHGNQLIDIRQQQTGYDSFQLCKINQQLEGMKISDYIDYLNDPTRFSKKEGLASDQKLFAVNVNMQGWDKECKHLKQFLPRCLRPQGINDALSYLRQEIDGVNIPQIYIKTEGVWTGGHQENLSVNAININHGPADCIWITVDNEFVPKLRSHVMGQYQVDILKYEGLWFKEPEYFLINNIPFRYTVQKKGDVVILGAGCLHWVKALGQTINSAWNQVALDEYSLQAMSDRHKINKEINYRTVIPYKNLMLDIYIHEKELGQKTTDRILSELQNFFDYENQKLALIDPAQSALVECCKEVQLCTKCEHEIFLYFYHEDQDYLCLDCVLNKANHKNLQISLKYRYHCFYFLLQQQPLKCDTEFCCPYTGRTKCTIQTELKPEYEESSFKFKGPAKLNSMLHGTDKMKKKKVERQDFEIEFKETQNLEKTRSRMKPKPLDKKNPQIKRVRVQ